VVKKKTKTVSKSKSDDDKKVFALLGTLLPILGYIIAVLANKKDPYVMHYAKQGLGLGILWIIAMAVTFVLIFIPFIGWALSGLISLGMIVLWLIGIIYSLSGEKKNIPVAEMVTEKLF